MSSVRQLRIDVDVLDLKPKLDRLPPEIKKDLKPVVDAVAKLYDEIKQRQRNSSSASSEKSSDSQRRRNSPSASSEKSSDSQRRRSPASSEKSSDSQRRRSPAADPFIADLLATKSHNLNVPPYDLYKKLMQIHPDHSFAKDAKEFTKTLLENTGNALLKNPMLWTKVPAILRDYAEKDQDRAVDLLEETDDPHWRTRVLEKSKERFKKGDFTISMAGLVMHFNTAVRLSAMLEYLCAELLELAGNATRDLNKKTVTVYFIRLAIAYDKDLTEFFNVLGVETGASKCMEIPKGLRGYPTARKDGSHPPAFRADLCFQAKEFHKRGVDGKMYVTDGKKWTMQ